MKILVIDTATEACSVALYNADGIVLSEEKKNDGNDDCIDSIFEICPQQHSQQILPMIDKVMSRNKLDINDLDALAYGRGPGSFTGVRIAASTIQGLALGSDLPVIQISTLAAMAQENYQQFGFENSAVLIDARMQEVYCGIYSVNEGITCAQVEESVISPSKATTVIQQFHIDKQALGFAGTGFDAYPEVFPKRSHSEKLQNTKIHVNYPNARYMVALAIDAFTKQDFVKAQHIKPVYVRDTVTWQKLPHKR